MRVGFLVETIVIDVLVAIAHVELDLAACQGTGKSTWTETRRLRRPFFRVTCGRSMGLSARANPNGQQCGQCANASNPRHRSNPPRKDQSNHSPKERFPGGRRSYFALYSSFGGRCVK